MRVKRVYACVNTHVYNSGLRMHITITSSDYRSVNWNKNAYWIYGHTTLYELLFFSIISFRIVRRSRIYCQCWAEYQTGNRQYEHGKGSPSVPLNILLGNMRQCGSMNNNKCIKTYTEMTKQKGCVTAAAVCPPISCFVCTNI